MKEYACRFCWHSTAEHNRIVGCPHCWCAGTPGEASPMTDKELDRVAIPAGEYAPGYETKPEPVKIDRKSRSLLEVGDTFRFRGLHNGAMDKADNGEDETHIQIRDFTANGKVMVESWKPNWQTWARSLFDVPYDRALLLVEHNIWQSLEDV